VSRVIDGREGGKVFVSNAIGKYHKRIEITEYARVGHFISKKLKFVKILVLKKGKNFVLTKKVGS